MAASIRPIDTSAPIDALLYKTFTNRLRRGYVEVGDDNMCLPVDYTDFEQRIRKFKVYDDDVYLSGFPKSGTSWSHEMIWLIANDLDYERAKILNSNRYGMLEEAILYDYSYLKLSSFQGKHPMYFIEELERPRCIKTHLCWSLLPEEITNGTKHPKIIHILRNPKDCCVSHYHFTQYAVGFSGTLEEFCEIYLAGRVPYGPYWKFVLSYWNQRHNPNIIFIRFEDMVKDLPTVIRKVSKFLNKTITDQDVEKLVKYLSFDSMTNNPAVNNKQMMDEIVSKFDFNVCQKDFIRDGTAGNYKAEMSKEMDKKFSDWIEENTAGTDFEL